HGQLGAAVESLEASRDTLDRHEVADPRLRARVLVTLATAYRRLNRAAKALSTYEAALAPAARTSEIRTAAQGYMGIAVSLYDAGELDGAINNYARALELFARLGDTSFELSVLQSLATVHVEQGEIEAARRAAERCLERADAVDDPNMRAIAETILARVALAEGDHEQALRVVTNAESALAALGDERQRAEPLHVASSRASRSPPSRQRRGRARPRRDRGPPRAQGRERLPRRDVPGGGALDPRSARAARRAHRAETAQGDPQSRPLGRRGD